jgi:hypothetical protein
LRRLDLPLIVIPILIDPGPHLARKVPHWPVEFLDKIQPGGKRREEEGEAG